MSQHGWGHGHGPQVGQGYGYGPHGHGQYGQPGPIVGPLGGLAVPTCRLCGAPTAIHSKVATGGWVVFFMLLVVCFPLCFLGLLIRDHGQRCTSCFAIQGGMG